MTTISRGRRSSAQRKGDRNEQAIIDTAERLLITQPLHEVTVEALARGAGISRSSFYFYFSSKEDVLLSLLDRLGGEMNAVITTLEHTIAEDPLASLTAAMQASAKVWHEHGPVLQASLEMATTETRIRGAWQTFMNRFVTTLAEVIDAERARGAAPNQGPTARQLASALVWAHNHAFQQSFLGDPSALTGDEITPVLVELFYRTIYAKPCTPPQPGNRH
ncbi:MAG: TetR/AcrR family transcriptional regulator [Mycobacterium sp.]|nr:TetR/AcrR family transcriptional regulator [Mycobacterium sp.]